MQQTRHTFEILTACCALLIAGCGVEKIQADRNGLDGNLRFGADPYARVAVGATTAIDVERTLDYDAATCVLSSTGYCAPLEPTLEPIQIVEAGCGDDCVATIKTDGRVGVDVTSSVAGDVVLSVRARATDGSAEFTDRFPIHYATPTGFELTTENGNPMGPTFATAVGAHVSLGVCAIADSSACLTGTFVPKVTPSDPFMDVQLCPKHANPNDDTCTFGITAVGPGVGDVTLSALGLTRSLPFRAVTAEEWVSVEFHRPDRHVSGDTSASAFLGPLTTEETIAPYGSDIIAAARLADGTLVLIPAARIDCAPEARAQIRAYITDNEVLGSLARPGAKPSPGDATCAVVGYEGLGQLAVHVVGE
ncbi:MAG: hypothetical protein ABI678_12470 [Kofleriaceae bacterium]